MNYNDTDTDNDIDIKNDKDNNTENGNNNNKVKRDLVVGSLLFNQAATVCAVCQYVSHCSCSRSMDNLKRDQSLLQRQ